MSKILTAKQKSEELGITTSGLAKTRHLYKHIKKSPRKYLYFKEDPQEAVRPNTAVVRDPLVKSRRRDVSQEDTRYHSCPGGSGGSFKVLNQMRAKASLEGKVKPGDLKYLDAAMAIKIKDNAQQIVEQEQNRKRSELLAEEEQVRRRDPSRYGGMVRGSRSRLLDVRTPWRNLFETPKTEYDLALEELEDTPKNKYY